MLEAQEPPRCPFQPQKRRSILFSRWPQRTTRSSAGSSPREPHIQMPNCEERAFRVEETLPCARQPLAACVSHAPRRVYLKTSSLLSSIPLSSSRVSPSQAFFSCKRTFGQFSAGSGQKEAWPYAHRLRLVCVRCFMMNVSVLEHQGSRRGFRAVDGFVQLYSSPAAHCQHRPDITHRSVAVETCSRLPNR